MQTGGAKFCRSGQPTLQSSWPGGQAVVVPQRTPRPHALSAAVGASPGVASAAVDSPASSSSAERPQAGANARANASTVERERLIPDHIAACCCAKLKSVALPAATVTEDGIFATRHCVLQDRLPLAGIDV
jgi:hypothetical protein